MVIHMPESPPEKPWAILGITRKQYAAARPWTKAGMTKEKYAEMLNLIPHEAMQILKDEADAETRMLSEEPLFDPPHSSSNSACLKFSVPQFSRTARWVFSS